MNEIKKDEFVSDWSVYPNFQEWEFACPSSGKAYMQKRFMDKLQRARTIAGVSFHISSGYRDCRWHFKLVHKWQFNLVQFPR